MWWLFRNAMGHCHMKILGNTISWLPASSCESVTHSHNTKWYFKLAIYISLYLWLYLKRMLRILIHILKGKNREGESGEGRRRKRRRRRKKEIHLRVRWEGAGSWGHSERNWLRHAVYWRWAWAHCSSSSTGPTLYVEMSIIKWF